MPTIGTAGHIDHGKSALVKAITSIDPDRLPEEKRRGITVDLGFAWFETEQKIKVGVIDVPGHSHYINNVISGLSGIDAVLLAVAADDGWMPQTEEHLQIINLLQINQAVVAITKVDLVDEDWLEIIEQDIREHLEGSILASAPIIGVSVKTGKGLSQLRSALDGLVYQLPPRLDIDKPRLPVDRVFNIKGSGIVVTGTLCGGSLSPGRRVLALPQMLSGSIRSIECYKAKVTRVAPGNRVAINLAGVKRDDIDRGTILVTPEVGWEVTNVIDAAVTLLPGCSHCLRDGSEMTMHLETSHISTKVRILGEGPEGELYIRFLLHQPVSAYLGECFILRMPSPSQTIGGGKILDIPTRGLRNRDIPKRVEFLKRRRRLDTASLVLTEVEEHHYIQRERLLNATLISTEEINRVIDELIDRDELKVADSFIVDSKYYYSLAQQALEIVAEVHRSAPLERGVPYISLQSRLHVEKDIFDSLVADLLASGKLGRYGDYLGLQGYAPRLSPEEEAMAKRIMELLGGQTPPTRQELADEIPGSEGVVRFLCEEGTLIEIGEGILLPIERYQDIKERVSQFLSENGRLTIQDMRALLGLSRKYILPLLARLDRDGITRREGDVRVAAKDSS